MNGTISEWLERLASKTPSPGGGAVAALAAAVSAAQLSMVAVYTTGPKWADRESDMQNHILNLRKLQQQSLSLADSDASAFAKVSQAYALPKDTDHEKAERTAEIQLALLDAVDPPVQTYQLSAKLLDVATDLMHRGNPNVLSDVAVGASMARASIESAEVNIEINMHAINDPETKQQISIHIENIIGLIQKADIIVETIRDKLGTS